MRSSGGQLEPKGIGVPTDVWELVCKGSVWFFGWVWLSGLLHMAVVMQVCLGVVVVEGGVQHDTLSSLEAPPPHTHTPPTLEPTRAAHWLMVGTESVPTQTRPSPSQGTFPWSALAVRAAVHGSICM